MKGYKLRDQATFQTYKSSLFYWSITIGMILCGGAWAVFNGITNENPINVLLSGASAPLSFAGLGNAASTFTPPGTGSTPPAPGTAETRKREVGSIFKFLTWR